MSKIKNLIYEVLLEERRKLLEEQSAIKEQIEKLKNTNQLCDKCYKECITKLNEK